MIPYGEKTVKETYEMDNEFESSVNPYGEKTTNCSRSSNILFESSVNPYGENSTFVPKLYDFHIRVIGDLDHINAQFYRWILL